MFGRASIGSDGQRKIACRAGATALASSGVLVTISRTPRYLAMAESVMFVSCVELLPVNGSFTRSHAIQSQQALVPWTNFPATVFVIDVLLLPARPGIQPL